MKTKHIIFLLSIVFAIAACKKTPDKIVNPPPNPNTTDSIMSNPYTGNYACVVIYQRTQLAPSGGPYEIDSIIGLDTISISGTSRKCIVETGNFLVPNDNLSGDSLVNYSNDSTYTWTDIHGTSTQSAVFFRANDSMALTYQIGTSIMRSVRYFYNGRKMH
jgi:hypothetical protein